MEVRTPLLVDVSTNWDTYYQSLSRKSKKTYKATMKQFTDLRYEEMKQFDSGLVEQFMSLWEEQLIHGERKKWAFGIGYVEELVQRDIMRCFVAYRGSECVSVHFVEVYNDYVECHPPIYSKTRYPGLAKFMWFNLIKWATREKISFLDLGGGHRGTWPELIRNRHNHPKLTYKWIYVPENVKQNPDTQLNYIVKWDTIKYLCEDLKN